MAILSYRIATEQFELEAIIMAKVMIRIVYIPGG